MPKAMRYYFLHIPKTAGCTMAYGLLPTFFEPEEICPHVTFDALLSIGDEERAKYRLFHGHFYNHIQHFIPEPLNVLTLLRHPFERAISHYRYILSSPGHPLHKPVSAAPDFGAYLRDRRLFAPNSLTLALAGELDPATILRRAAWRGWKPGSFDDLFSEETFQASARARHVEAAKAVLDRCFLVGLQEEMTKTASLLHRHFGRPITGPIGTLNESGGTPFNRNDLPPDVFAELAGRHEHDLEVYAHGKALFERQWAESADAVPKPRSAAPAIRSVAKPAAPSQRLYYMTPPWSGGGDLGRELVQGCYRPSEVCPARDYDELLALPSDALREYSAFHGDFLWPLETIIGGPVARVTFLIDPVESAAQQYREYQAHRSRTLPMPARDDGALGDFVNNGAAYIPNMLTLSMARQLSRDNVTQLKATARHRGISFDEALRAYVTARPATSRDLARAKRRLARCAFIGFADTLETSLEGLGRILDWPEITHVPTPETRRRVGARTAVSAADRAAIRNASSLDVELYDFARTLKRPARQGRRLMLADALDRLFDRLSSHLRLPSRGNG
jgi:hypothetical protein